MFEKLLAKQHIRNLDLGSVRGSLVEKLGWDHEQARRVEVEYKRFLYALAHKDKDDILSPPSQEVDDFWHQHILDTRKYREDCQTIFGHYVDHTPGLSSENQRKADERCRQVYDNYNIALIPFDSDGSPRRNHDSGSVGCGGSGGESYSSHDSHGHHSGSTHSGDGSSHAGDSGGHGGDSGAGDSGGGDSGGGGCSSGGCGAGCGGG
jgi:hypothetical protein